MSELPASMRIPSHGWRGKRLLSRLRPHLPFIFIMPLLIIVMTWPTFARILETDEHWLHQGGTNILDRYWDTWHIRRVLAGEADFYFTDSIFHPQGVSLAWRQFAVPHALAFAGLQLVMPTATAYNLCFLLMVLFNSMAAYVFLNRQFKDGLVSLFGASVVGLAPLFLYGSTTPDLILIGTMPLALYCFQRAVTEDRWLFAALSGIAIGVTAFIGLYIYVCLALTLLVYGVYVSATHWRSKSFWLSILVLAAFAGSISVLRFYPMLVDVKSTRAGLSKYSLLESNSGDVVDMLVNNSNPWTERLLHDGFGLQSRSAMGRGYLGYVPLFLVAFGILRGRRRYSMLLWVGILSLFIVLRAGDNLTFNDVVYKDFALPKFYLNQVFPFLFDAFGLSGRFQIGVALPLAVASCFGLHAIVCGQPRVYRHAAVGICLTLLALEYYVPIKGSNVGDDRIAHIEWLRREETKTLKLIHLPMRKPVNTQYMYLQTVHGFPIANGLINRTPDNAYEYMRANDLLRAWMNDENINCALDNPTSFLMAIDQLQADGFSHVLYHPGLPTARGIRAGITSFTPSYEDAYVLIYDMDDLRQSCHSSNLLHQELFAPLSHLARHRAILPDENVSIISVHPSQAADYAVFKSQAAALSGWNGLLHTFHVNDELIIQSLDSRYSDAGDIVQYDDGLVLIYNPPLTGTSQLPEVESILSESYRLCERALDTDDAIVEFHAKPFLPCELVFSDTKQRVHYDSGLQMRNLHYELNGRRLDFYALWAPPVTRGTRSPSSCLPRMGRKPSVKIMSSTLMPRCIIPLTSNPWRQAPTKPSLSSTIMIPARQ